MTFTAFQRLKIGQPVLFRDHIGVITAFHRVRNVYNNPGDLRHYKRTFKHLRRLSWNKNHKVTATIYTGPRYSLEEIRPRHIERIIIKPITDKLIFARG